MLPERLDHCRQDQFDYPRHLDEFTGIHIVTGRLQPFMTLRGSI